MTRYPDSPEVQCPDCGYSWRANAEADGAYCPVCRMDEEREAPRVSVPASQGDVVLSSVPTATRSSGGTRNKITIDCPECDAGQKTDIIHQGEIVRGTNCDECGEWFTVYEK